MIKIKIPPNKSKNYIENFFIKRGLKSIVNQSRGVESKVNQMILKQPYIPELKDLYRIYQFIILNKRTTILEFGSGWSSLILNLAINELQKSNILFM